MNKKRDWRVLLNPNRRNFLKTVGAGAAVVTTSGLVEIGLGEQQAAAFAFVNYYLPLSPENLKSNVKLLAFDIAYNMGLSKAITYIQQCAGVVADGKVGPATKKAMANVSVDCLQQKRVAFYNALNKQSKYQKFYRKKVMPKFQNLVCFSFRKRMPL